MRTVYYTATSLDGFIATPDHSLEWLFTRDQDPASPFGWDAFEPRVGASVMGANTYQWLLDNAPGEVSSGPAWVLTHRSFPPRDGVTFTADPVARVHRELREAAGEQDIWVVGGGALAGEFAAAGLLDEIVVSIAPVTLGSGTPLLPHHVELSLRETGRNRDFVCARYAVLSSG
jgi:dihydrofolate reductase